MHTSKLADAEYMVRCLRAVLAGEVTAEVYRRGCLVTGWPQRWPRRAATGRRGVIRHQSRRSLIRASWAISNTEADFSLFSTLTFREPHKDPKACLRSFIRTSLGLDPCRHPYAWVQEYQTRGVVHYHLLWNYADSIMQEGFGYPETYRDVVRRKQSVRVLSGDAEAYLIREWVSLVGDYDPKFLRFQSGGVHERVTNPELAGTYLGSYAGKEGQKRLPDGEAPQGRWWYISDAAKPVPRRTVTVDAWLDKKPHKLVHNPGKSLGTPIEILHNETKYDSF